MERKRKLAYTSHALRFIGVCVRRENKGEQEEKLMVFSLIYFSPFVCVRNKKMVFANHVLQKQYIMLDDESPARSFLKSYKKKDIFPKLKR